MDGLHLQAKRYMLSSTKEEECHRHFMAREMRTIELRFNIPATPLTTLWAIHSELLSRHNKVVWERGLRLGSYQRFPTPFCDRHV